MATYVVINEYLFKDMFGSKFLKDVPYMNGALPDNFEISMEAAKAAIMKDNLDLYDFRPL